MSRWGELIPHRDRDDRQCGCQDTDADEPYDADDLAQRAQPPNWHSYASRSAYTLGWYTWRALRRDAELNAQEKAAQWPVIEDHVRNTCRTDR